MTIKQSLGNKRLLKLHKTAFLCSMLSPLETKEAIDDWAKKTDIERNVVLCGNHSDMEQYLFDLLLRNKIPTILFIAESLHDRWDDKIKSALEEERLLIVTHCDSDVHFTTRKSADDRNRLMLEMADDTIVGYCSENGKIQRQIMGMDNVRILTKKEPESKTSASCHRKGYNAMTRLFFKAKQAIYRFVYKIMHTM